MENKYVVCPNCGREYLPSEIFIPQSFFGKPTFIERDQHGKIITALGNQPDINEVYCCDNCETSFSVHTNISFETHIDIKTDFSHDYETRLKK